MTLSHHNHHQEFRKIGDLTVMDIVLNNTKTLGFELDTYWVQYGGANPESWCRKVANRIPLLHLKDYAVDSDKASRVRGNRARQPGISGHHRGGTSGRLPVVYVEQDTCPGDPFDSLQISFDYIQSHLVS
jgi:sugar phosphate isomerase/epimerase